jgi:DNA polymerase bacteriophage-type
MKTLSIDIETYSDVPLPKTGVYRYCESSDFEILLFGYSVDSGPVQVVDLACGENLPDEIIAALEDESVIKWAFNASFERICLSRFLGYPTGEYLDPKSWHCSMIWAATMGLPLSLEGVGAVLGLEKQKLTEGKGLIKYFCQPCAATKSNGSRMRNRPFHAPDKWEAFKRYNIRDVETEMGIQHKLRKFPVPESVWEEYHIDQEINDRGVRLDMELVHQAIEMDARSREGLTAAIKDITKLENPNSVLQMKQWLSANGVKTDSLDKKAVAELLKNAPADLASVLTLRQQLAKSSVRKYQAMEKTVCADGRTRGMFQFYGANRTGRFSGRNIQLQNLPQNHLPDIADARALVRSGDFDAVSLLYEDVPDTLSQLIRTAFIPREGTQFLVADFSAIEARVIAWFAGEEWRQKVFANGGDIYCASASQMFRVPVEKHGINGHLRQKGKIAELALGYGGSVGALKAMGALEMGLTAEELPPLVDAWRQSNPHIVKFWWDVDHAVTEAVKYKHTTTEYGLTFSCRSGMLFITLPSGRNLAYVKPKLGTNKFGGTCITYEGIGSTKKWERLDSYGPKFVENIVQATARDILLYAMRTLRHCSIVMHIHDEVVIEADPRMSLDAEDISLESLAKSGNVGKSECLRCFKASLQTTPYKYLMECRLLKAAELLTTTDLPIGVISENVGFHQVSHFGKCFKEKTGYSPRDYRKNTF